MKITPVLQHITLPMGHSMPVWEIEDFPMPDINIEDCVELEALDQRNERLRKTNKRISLSYNFTEDMKHIWSNNIQVFNDYMKTKGYSDYSMEYIWFDRLLKSNVSPLVEHIYMLCDKPGWDMGMHLDNRNIFGVLILNLVDNPPGTGTQFARYHDSDIVYSGLTKKSSGVFFMNTSETWHAIKNMSDKNRYIMYIPVGIPPE